ncbi:DUF2711 family protein [Roseibium sp.]|uniref:DUF2711 family protein n=1 Tax=Roseibium sp. TaxID=1936156 RepID=UPI003BA94FD0
MKLPENYNDVIGLSSTGAPYLSGFGAEFDFAFVWLKPFHRISSARVTDFRPRANAEIRRPEGRPYKELKRLCFEEGQIWSWDYVAKQLKFKDISEIAIAASSNWSFLKEEYNRSDLGKKLMEFEETNSLEELHDNIITSYELKYLYRLLKDAGYEKISQFDITTNAENIDVEYSTDVSETELLDAKRVQFCSNRNLDFAISTWWGDFHVVIHGPKKLAESIRKSPMFEGFFCNELTACDWYLDVENQVGERKYISPPVN